MDKFQHFKEGLYENRDRSLFYRKSRALQKFYKNADLPEYKGEHLYPSGGNKNAVNYMNNFPDGFGEYSEEIKKEFFVYGSTVPREHTVAGNMWQHSMPNYERILLEGLNSYRERVLNISDIDIRDGLLCLLDGLNTYVNKCVSYLESVNADKKLTDALKKVPFSPAENIYEAIVSINFIMYIDFCDNLGCVERNLKHFYNDENVIPYLRNLYENIDVNGGYSMSLGGSGYSSLTVQCLEAAKGLRRPMIELFVDKNTPDYIWDKAVEVIKSGGGQPAIYNSDVLLSALAERFPHIKPDDMKKFCGGGCTESMLEGLSNVGSLDAGINTLLVLEKAIYDYLEKSVNFDEFYEFFMAELKSVADKVTSAVYESQKSRSVYNPLPQRTLLVDDCIDNGKDFNNGGARYMWSIISFAGVINVIDSLCVIRDFVFREKRYSPVEIISFMKENNKKFLEEARNHNVRFGIDNSESNDMAYKVSNDIFSVLDGKKTYFGSGFIPASIQFNTAAVAGEKIGATPDGREAFSSLAESVGAILNKDTEGPTALIKSVTSLNLKKACGTPVFNLTLNPALPDEITKNLLKSYISLGGVQVQVTCVSKEMLEEAYENPGLHKNMVVRVGGYSEYFHNLSDELKRNVIERTIY